MELYPRVLLKELNEKIGKGKAIMVTGPRQVGKTTLLREVLKGKDFLFLDGDDPTVRQLLTEANTARLKSVIGAYKLIFIDEAQRIEGIGLTSKIITDQFPEVQLLISGSSSFELNNQINEPLTGRKWEYHLYPISWREMETKLGFLQAEQQLEQRLLYGFYPEVLNRPGEEREILKELVGSYLYKDILALSGINKPEVLDKLVLALALQVGSQVNYQELAQLVGVDRNTVIKYIDLLCKGFVLFKLTSFSRNVRNEIKTQHKIYFYDNGIRNMVVGNFSPLSMRTDVGALWENFLISERYKWNEYTKSYARRYFWRTAQQQEIDYVEEKDGQVFGYEFKWNPKRKGQLSKTFLDAYQAEGKVVHKENFREFISPEDAFT